jgi:hypothetical protein
MFTQNVVCNKENDEFLFLRAFRHQRGAIALLDARKKLGHTGGRDISLDKYVRQQIVSVVGP